MPSPKELAHLHIPLKQILKATNNFSNENLIREGGFGEVYKGNLFVFGRQINIIARRLHHRYGQGKIEFWKEIIMLVSLKHKNLVSIVGFCDEDDEKIIINKLETHETLDKYLSDPDLTWIQRLEICVGVARALSYIHYDAKRDFSVIHRNIKSSKILLDKDWKPKLSGFELSLKNTRARRNRLLLTQLSGTLGYVDPVYENTKSVTPKSDVYSFGVVLFEVLCRRRAFIPGEHEWCPPQQAKPDSKVVNQDEMVVAPLNKQMDNTSSSFTNTSPEMYPKSFIYSTPAQKQQPPPSFNNKSTQMHPFSTNISPEQMHLSSLYNLPVQMQPWTFTYHLKKEQSSSLSLNNSLAQKHKRSFIYSSSSSESKSSKLQEEFFTPQPLMTMKRLEHFPIPKEGLLAQVAKVHYEEKKLENIIDPHLWKQMDPQSFHVFSETAYYCLKERRAERPNIDQIVKRLEKALELQSTSENTGQQSEVEGASSNHWKGGNLEHLKIGLDDIKSATENFAKTYCIGAGGYGMVYKAELEHFDSINFSKTEGRDECEFPKKRSTVAIKRILSREDTLGEQGFFIELEMLSSCKHPNVISLLGFCDEGSEKILVYELATNGSLNDYLGSSDNVISLNWAKRIKICLNVAHGLNYLHTNMEDKQRIIHRDIKSDNVLLDKNWEAKLADFGLSKFVNQEESGLNTNTVAGTKVYLDPEYEKTGNLKKASDIYSFGVVLFEIMCGRLAYDTIYTQHNDMGLAPIARKCFNEGTIKDMLDPKLKEEIDDTTFTLAKGPNQDSLDVFTRIAYQCLAEDQIDRPRMEIIIKELEKALYFQENRKDNLKIPLEDIKLATQNFSCNNCIGIGGFGQVYKGVVTHDDGCKTLVAKRLDMRGDQGEQEFLTELEILFEYKHENIIHLVGYCNELGEKIIVYDYASNGSLDMHLKNVSLTWTKRLNICIDVASGLHFLHCGVVTEERVIHRDIKCANILLNGDWKAKISDFGLSILSPVNQEMEYAIENLVGTIGYVDPLYESTGFLTKESDIYSFGVVLFEILFGRLLVPSIHNYERQPLTTFIKHAFEEGKLDLIVFEGIKDQIVPKSLSTFQMIVARCLHDDREKRPTAREVLVELMKALEFQEDYEIWEPKLPRDYKEILKMSKSTEIHTKTKKDLYSMLCKGILLQEGKVLFTLGDNGERNEMISARRFSYKNRWSHKWRSIPGSRFQKVAEMLDISNLNIQIKIRTQFLSPEVNYRVHLIFKFCVPTKSATKPMYVNLKYKRGNENLHAYFGTWREDGWMMIELCQLSIHKKHVDFEILLESFSRCYCGSRVVYIEGIEFQAIKDVKREEIGNLTVVQDVIKSDSEIERLPQLPSNNEEMFERSETYLGGSWLSKIKRTKDHMLNEVNTKKDHALSKMHQKKEHVLGKVHQEKERVLGKVHQKKDRFLSKVKRKKDNLLNRKKDDLISSEEVIHDPSNGKLSDLEPSVQTRFQYVIETPSQQVYRIKCKIGCQILSGSACYLVFKLSEKCRGLHCPVIVRNLLQGKKQETGILYFRAPSPWNLRDNDWIPTEREDGWMEVMVWKFNSKYEFKNDFLFVNLKLVCYEGNMNGLVVCGVEIRPM